ncbi:MAG: hypothetical protein WKG06_02045 [Segetibacter sp.]
MLQKGKISWKCLIGGASKWKHGTILKKIITTKKPRSYFRSCNSQEA